MEKHASFDDPPDYLFFRGRAGWHAGHTSKENLPSHPEGAPPSQQLNMRSELIGQLGKCASLCEKGVLSDEEYQELQKSIMTDIKTEAQVRCMLSDDEGGCRLREIRIIVQTGSSPRGRSWPRL